MERIKQAMYLKAQRHIQYAINILMTWNPDKSQELFDFFVIWLQDREIEKKQGS